MVAVHTSVGVRTDPSHGDPFADSTNQSQEVTQGIFYCSVYMHHTVVYFSWTTGVTVVQGGSARNLHFELCKFLQQKHYSTVSNFLRSNFSWFGELRQFHGFIFSWRSFCNRLVNL